MGNINVSALLVIANLVVLIGGAIGGYIVLRSTVSQGAQKLQTTMIETLQAQNDIQEKQIAALEKKIKRLDRTILTIQYTLQKRRRLRLEINEDAITITDERTSAEITVPVRLTGPLEKEEKEN
jgi:uncharacterized protein HemX